MQTETLIWVVEVEMGGLPWVLLGVDDPPWLKVAGEQREAKLLVCTTHPHPHTVTHIHTHTHRHRQWRRD